MGSMILETRRPHILCFHCRVPIYPETLAQHRQYRSQYGIDIFKCPSCEKDFKIDPRDFLDLREQVEKGVWPTDKPPAITGLSPTEYTPYELIEAQFQSQKNRTFTLAPHVPIVKSGKWIKAGIVVLLTAIAILWMSR